MAGEFEKESESTRVRLAQADLRNMDESPYNPLGRVSGSFNQQETRGINGRLGFIPYPGLAECGDEFDVWATRMAHHDAACATADARSIAFEAGANKQMAARHAARAVGPMNFAANQRMLLDEHARDAAMKVLTEESMGGVAKTVHSLGTMFSRETILGILRAKRAECVSPRRLGQTPDGPLVMAELIDVVENLE